MKQDIRTFNGAFAQTGGLCYIDYAILLISNDHIDRYMRIPNA